MKTTLTNLLKNSLDKLPFIGMLLFALLWLKNCGKSDDLERQMKRKDEIAAQNQRAAKDSIRILKNKAGEIEAVTSSFVSSVKDLEALNKDLYAELRKEIGIVKSLIKTEVSIQREEVTMSNELVKYPDHVTYGLLFKDIYRDSSLSWIVNGQSRFKLENGTIYPGKTTLNQNDIRVKLVVGFKENKDNYEIWARSGSPLVKFDKLEGVTIIPKKPDITCPLPKRQKKLGLGFSAGYGLNQNLRLSPFIGLSINYNLVEF